ncbi:MAG TPA: glycosyltransferase, partial [Candidatus Limnocylindrales bacterium]
LHEGWVTNNLVAAAAARRARVPYIVVPHGVYEPAWRQQLKPPRPVREAFERRMLDGAAAVQVFFETEEAPIRALAPRARFVVAPTGCRPATRRWIGGGGYLAWVGRFDPFHKGLDLLAQALAILPPDRRPFVRLHGYDYKGGLADFHELVARLGLKAWVKVGGVIVGEERQRFLAESDGYVLPSRWESQGLALLEALAMGVPSLVSDRSHVAPLLADRGAAAVAPIDPLRLADAILELGVRRAELSANARRVVSSEFSWDRIVADFLRQLDGLGALAGDADLARAPNAVASSPADRG